MFLNRKERSRALNIHQMVFHSLNLRGGWHMRMLSRVTVLVSRIAAPVLTMQIGN